MFGVKLHKTVGRIVCTSILVCFAIFSYSQNNSDGRPRKNLVNGEADILRPITVGDSSVYNLLGNVVFHHKENGTIITCDSAIRYSERRVECFNNVVVNKGDTYVYGDRASYNGEINTAKIYAPIIKMVNKDATLYTYQFSFNTLSNIVTFGGGATMSQKENLLESQRGNFYADSNILVCVQDVEIRNPDYKLQSDSVLYNLNSDVATFYTQTYIWNSKNEILSAKRGEYDQKRATYDFTSNSYILTEKQELWSDTLNYESRLENAVLHSNVQMLDGEQKVMIFGDFAEYWGGELGRAVITEDPSMINFNPEQPDTAYMRSDSMFIYTISADSLLVQDSTSKLNSILEEREYVEEAYKVALDSTAIGESDTTAMGENGEVNEVADSSHVERVLSEADKKKLEKRLEKERKKELKIAKKKAATEIKRAKAAAKKEIKDRERALKKRGKKSIADEVPEVLEDSSATQVQVDSTNIGTTPEIVALDSTAISPDMADKDAVQRIIKAYGDVKIYRTDFQVVCDSLVGFSSDSTLHLYIEPILWTQSNQITSTVIDIYTKNQVMDRAVFTGEPIMSSKVGDENFNQVKGKVIEAYMIDNEIKRTEVIGNGQTYYYMQDDEDGTLTSFAVVESADITFIMDSSTVTRITFKRDPPFKLYPMDKIPISQELTLPGFRWEEARRPLGKEDVFNRTIRASRREEYQSKPKPIFDITTLIFDNKAKLIEDGVWRERDDKIPDHILNRYGLNKRVEVDL